MDKYIYAFIAVVFVIVGNIAGFYMVKFYFKFKKDRPEEKNEEEIKEKSEEQK